MTETYQQVETERDQLRIRIEKLEASLEAVMRLLELLQKIRED